MSEVQRFIQNQELRRFWKTCSYNKIKSNKIEEIKI